MNKFVEAFLAFSHGMSPSVIQCVHINYVFIKTDFNALTNRGPNFVYYRIEYSREHQI